MSQALIRHGESPRSRGALIAWASARRERYGPSGFSPDGVRSARAKFARAIQARRTCRKGHRWTMENTHWVVGANPRRQCKACRAVAKGRYRWRQLQGRKRADLRAALMQAHPDHGGTSAKFRAVWKRYKQAVA